MLNKKQKGIFFLLFFLFFIFSANFTLAIEFSAPEINYPSLPFPGVDSPQVFLEKIGKGEIPGEQALPLYVKYFYYLFLMIAGLLSLGVIVYGGLLYLISAGAPVKMISAKEQITGGILGLVILLSSYLILATINPQLAIFRLPGLERVTPAEIEIPSLEEKVPTYFQIPVGIIIENAVLNEEAQEKLDYVYLAAEAAAESAKELYELSEEIHSLVEKTDCGLSYPCATLQCSASGCTGRDNQSDIKATIEKTGSAIEDLEKKTNEISIAKIDISNDLSQLGATGVLMSLKHWEVFTHNDFLSIKHDYEGVKKDVKINSDPFPGWEDIDLEIDGQTIKDPVTFYLDREENEDAIYLAKLIYEDIDTIPTEPPEGWSTPPEGTGQLQWPTAQYRVTSAFGWRIHPIFGYWHFHKGIDLGPRIPGQSEPIYAAAKGIVRYVGYSRGYGERVIIEHKELGLVTLYAHLASYNVTKGDEVKQGEKIGMMGKTGWATGIHLHFEVRDNAGQLLNPEDYF